MKIVPSEFFSLLSDETRLRCLILLHTEGELCVCEINQIVGGIQPKISRHLALLRQSGLVLDERRGQWVYYKIDPTLTKWVKELLNYILKSLAKEEPYRSDIKKLQRLKKTSFCS